MNSKEQLDALLINHQDIKESLLELFKKEEVALRWLTLPKSQLSSATPLSLLGKDKKAVRDLIYTIETGDLS
jgi:uncharacterized protein (DUF2384 family)